MKKHFKHNIFEERKTSFDQIDERLCSTCGSLYNAKEVNKSLLGRVNECNSCARKRKSIDKLYLGVYDNTNKSGAGLHIIKTNLKYHKRMIKRSSRSFSASLPFDSFSKLQNENDEDQPIASQSLRHLYHSRKRIKCLIVLLIMLITMFPFIVHCSSND